jgi:thioesterase domain-containing protein
MRTHEQMPLVDTFGRSIVIVDRAEHAKHWARAERKRIDAEFQKLRESDHALKVRLREVEQLEDELRLDAHKRARAAEAERAELWTEYDEHEFRRMQHIDHQIDAARGK